MIIDTDKIKKPYVQLYLPDGRLVQVKLEEDGIVVDVFTDGVSDDLIETTFVFYDDMLEAEA